MLNRLFLQIINSFGIVTRTFRSFFTRQVAGITARFRRLTSFSRQAAKALPKAMQSAAMVTKKPTKRTDYFETSRLFISKSLLVLLVLALIAFGILFYYLIWPWLVSRFFTKHMFCEDEAVPAYSGKVVLYYDPEKQHPKLSGRLTEGSLDGQGKAYDEEGLIIYSGGFSAWVYDGKGHAYEKGVLSYEGDFSNGVYEGNGTLYADGALLYTGGFSAGLYHGQGSLYSKGNLVYKGGFADGLYEGDGTEYQDGVMIYKGGFSGGLYNGEGAAQYDPTGALLYRGGFLDGKRNGDGIEYHPKGGVKFRGKFLDGAYDGLGTLYNEDGTLLYEGAFQGGLYNGAGRLYMSDELSIEGEFSKGEPAGVVRIYRGSRLYYEGEVRGLVPDGEGTLYSSDGVAVYQGPFMDGTINGAFLIGMSAEEARAVFADAQLIETRGEKAGFTILNPALGMALFSTLKTDESDPVVYYAYLYDEGADLFFDLMPWRTAAEYEAWCLETGHEQAENRVAKRETPNFTGGVPFARRSYHKVSYYYADYIFVAWSEEEEGDLFMVEWISSDDLPGSAGTDEAGSANASRMDRLLGKLELSASAGGGTSGSAGSDEDDADPDHGAVYYGAGDPSALTRGSAPEVVERRVGYMMDYLLEAETREALESQLADQQKALKKQKQLLAMGTATEESVKALEGAVNKLQLGVNKCMVAMDRAQLGMDDEGGAKLADYDLEKACFVADPAGIDIEGLNAAVAGAGKTLDPKLKLALMELEIAFQELTQAVDEYETAKEAAEKILSDYAMGNADDLQLAAAKAARGGAVIAVYAKLCAYTRMMAALNTMSGGYLASQCGWAMA